MSSDVGFALRKQYRLSDAASDTGGFIVAAFLCVSALHLLTSFNENENYLVEKLYRYRARNNKQPEENTRAVSTGKLKRTELSLSMALMRVFCPCCRKSELLKENRLERMFRKGRAKVKKDLDIVALIRNQKILVAAVNEIMTKYKFRQITRLYFMGNISSDED